MAVDHLSSRRLVSAKLEIGMPLIRLVSAFITRHSILFVLLTFGAARPDWLLTSSDSQDPWRQFDGFKHLGTLEPATIDHYKTTRSLLVLVGQVLIRIFGELGGQLALSVLNLTLLYVAARWLLDRIFGEVNSVSLCLITCFPGFFGEGGWMYGLSLTVPIHVFVLGLLSWSPERRGSRGYSGFSGNALMVGVLSISTFFIHPSVTPVILVSVAISLVLLLRDRSIEVLGLVLQRLFMILTGGMLAVLIAEVAGWLSGQRKSVLLAGLGSRGKLDSAGAFDREPLLNTPILSWYLLPTFLFLLFLAVSLSPFTRWSISHESAATPLAERIQTTQAISLLAPAVCLFLPLMYESFLHISQYNPIVMTNVMCGAAVSLQSLRKRNNWIGTRPFFGDLLPFCAVAAVILGWQIAGAFGISRVGGATGLFGYILFAGLLLGALQTYSRWIMLILSCLGLFVFGMLTSTQALVFGNCDQRMRDTRAILGLSKVADLLKVQTPLQPVYLIADSRQPKERCSTDLLGIVNAAADQIEPFQAAGTFQSNVESRPDASSLVIANNRQQINKQITLNDQSPWGNIEVSRKLLQIADSVVGMQVYHAPSSVRQRLMSLANLMPAATNIALGIDGILQNETVLTVQGLRANYPAMRVALVMKRDATEVAQLFTSVTGVSLEGLGNSRSDRICERILSDSLDFIVVGPDLALDPSWKLTLQVLKSLVRTCLDSQGIRYIEEPSNSESPAVFALL